jgi:hypothetical protein
LQSIQPPGHVAAEYHQLFVNPGLSVQGHPIVPLPLIELSAQAIKPLSSSNSSSQNVWELDYTQFSLNNPAWPSFFDDITSNIIQDFGPCYIERERPRLVLYGPGSFVQQENGPHQVDKAYGTLVISLPSEHKRADITLSSEGQTHRLSTAHSSNQDLSVIAWTSTFDRQTSKLDSGYRLTISYNLHRTEPVSNPSSRQNQES